jgi:AcrR family transcriptional regulator
LKKIKSVSQLLRKSNKNEYTRCVFNILYFTWTPMLFNTNILKFKSDQIGIFSLENLNMLTMLIIFALLIYLIMLIMEKKEIQEQRMKGYFIQAAKEMIKGEGLRSISVRNIADRAGYSYATMYNYFRDINDLIFLCVKDFQEECREFVVQETSNCPRGLPKIKAIGTSYINYFIQYPGIFDLFYIENITGKASSKQTTAELIATFPDRLCDEEWNYCIEEKRLSAKEISVLKDGIMYLTAGLLLLYNNRYYPTDYKDFMNRVDDQFNHLLQL